MAMPVVTIGRLILVVALILVILAALGVFAVTPLVLMGLFAAIIVAVLIG